MAYDEYLADRIRRVFKEKKVKFTEKRMFGGLCFMVEDKMCIGLDQEKIKKENRVMARIGEFAYENALKKKGARPMTFTGRPMNGYVFVDPIGVDSEKDLEYWVQLCLDFNPLAKQSKKKKKAASK